MNKNVLLIGASSAIAVETASLLQKKGTRIIALSTKENLHHYPEFLKTKNYHAAALPAIEEPLSGLVYFPGTVNLKPFNRISKEEFVRDFEINALGAVNCIQQYLPKLKQGYAPSIVLISSVAAQLGMPFHASIAMAKAALEGLTKALAAEFAPSIRVNCIAPSLCNTALTERFLNTAEKLEAAKKRNPLNTIGSPRDIASSVQFLLSEESAWMTGQVLAVDGGMGTIKL